MVFELFGNIYEEVEDNSSKSNCSSCALLKVCNVTAPDLPCEKTDGSNNRYFVIVEKKLKDEMIQQCLQRNYDIIKNHIKKAMQNHEHNIYVGKESFAKNFEQDCVCLDKTMELLEKDGFEFHEADYSEWEICW